MRLLLVIFLFSAYLGSAVAYGQTKSPHHVDTSMYVVLKFDTTRDKLSADYLGRRPLSAYKRQYVAIINSKGQKEVWIGFFCREPEDWRKSEILVEDGGACYLVVRLNLRHRQASEMMANGIS
jgi:hypothetical protein